MVPGNSWTGQVQKIGFDSKGVELFADKLVLDIVWELVGSSVGELAGSSVEELVGSSVLELVGSFVGVPGMLEQSWHGIDRPCLPLSCIWGHCTC